jgi:hypothetical protein
MAHSWRRTPDSTPLDSRTADHVLGSFHVRDWIACTGDILDILGFVGDFGAGGLYIVARALDWGHGAIAHATADYGTKFLIVSGLLNLICVADAYHIAIGKKP